MVSRQALDAFWSLLKADAPEPDWQRFFAEQPDALAAGLPVHVLPSDIAPLGRAGRSEPDFLIYPRSSDSAGVYGVIELKRPSASIFSHRRRNVITLSPTAATGVQQLAQYDRQFEAHALAPRALCFESRSHLFLIIGRTAELARMEKALVPQALAVIPSDIRVLTYDRMLARLAATVPKRSIVLASASLTRNPPPLSVDSKPLQDLAAQRARTPVHFQGLGIRYVVPGRVESASDFADAVCRPHAPFPSPFSDGTYGVLLCSTDAATARAEWAHMYTRFLEATDEPPIDTEVEHLGLVVDAYFADLATVPQLNAMLHLSADHEASRTISAAIRQSRCAGFTYRSTHTSGRNLVIFDPRAISRAIPQGRSRFRWPSRTWHPI